MNQHDNGPPQAAPCCAPGSCGSPIDNDSTQTEHAPLSGGNGPDSVISRRRSWLLFTTVMLAAVALGSYSMARGSAQVTQAPPAPIATQSVQDAGTTAAPPACASAGQSPVACGQSAAAASACAQGASCCQSSCAACGR